MSEMNQATEKPDPSAAIRADGQLRNTEAATTSKAPKPAPEHKDSFRDSLETVVFVVFLVLLLKAFVAEAFVIPTGSMAITLYGEHCQVTCERCGYGYVVNAQRDNETLRTTDVICPNCRHKIEDYPVNSDGGDKVLVFKSRYDYADPDQHDVIVFKFPGEPVYLHGPPSEERRGGPQKDYIAHNYIKRLWGRPGDRLAIWYGDVHLRIGDGAEERLQIIRRTPDKYLSMRRIVSNFDYQDKLLALPPRWSDEGPAPTWQSADDGKAFQIAGGDRSWLTFRNYLRPERASQYEKQLAEMQKRLDELETTLLKRGNDAGLRDDISRLQTEIKSKKDELVRDLERARRPQLITDFLEYNPASSWHWTPDLMIECDVHVTESAGELVLELAGGVDQHRAVFNLENGSCALQTTREGRPLAFVDADGKELPADSAKADTKLHKTGKHSVRFCSFDQRLTLWVDNKLIFDDGLVFPSPKDEERGPRMADLRPVRIGASGAKVKVAKLQVYRDIYYTREASAASGDVLIGGGPEELGLTAEEEADLRQQTAARLTSEEARLPADTQRGLIEHRARPEKWSAYYPQKVGGRMPEQKNYPIVHPEFHPEDRLGPDEFFALGDNSTQSSDSRQWGQVPRRLLLGKAVSVYWPIPSRFGLIR